MPKILRILSTLLVVVFPFVLQAQHALLSKIAAISKQAKGKVGVSVLNIEDKDTLNFFGNAYCVMESVFKFPIAITVLNNVDKGKLSLDDKILVSKKDMISDTWSPLQDKYPEGNVEITINDLLKYMVSNSDNIACDILLKTLGGPKNVEDYIRSIGIKDLAMAASEAQMHKSWNIQYTNWCTPKAMVHLLEIFYKKKVLSKNSNALLMKMMEDCTTGPNRLKGLLPAGTKVVHRTGTTGPNTKGMTAATNDIGIITLPNGKHLAIAVFVNDAYADEATLDAVIAKITRAVYDDAIKN